MGELHLAILNLGRKASALGQKASYRLRLFFGAFWIVFLVELMSRGRWEKAFGWTFQSLPALALNTLAVFGFLLLLTALTASIRLSFWLVATLCLALGLISGIKLDILGVPLLPWDLLLTSESSDMLQYIKGLLSFTIISGLAVFIGLSILLLSKLPRMALSINWKQRLVMGIVSLLLLTSIYTDGMASLKKWANIQNIAWDQSVNVETNGFLLSTIMNLKFLFLAQPEGYDADKVRALASSHVPAAAGGVKPNVIVVLSESFWDATQIKGAQFSRDPIPFYHELAKKYTSGTMLSPQYGGGTANVEFEVLTGNSMRFLPPGSVPYNQYVDKGIDSLASILARQAYTSTAINPFHSWFYSSKKVYKNFGFSKYISQEFFDPDYEGPYLADRQVAKQIIDTSARSEGPDFIFANTMENHYHYYPGKFKENTIKVSGVTGEAQGLLETYAQGLTGADDMLKRLVTHYENSGEPTIVVFFGDHLPSLGDNYSAYKDSGYLQENDPDSLNKLFRVPVLVWNNYLPEHKEELNLSPSFLGPYILKLAEQPGTYYTDYLYQLYQSTPVIPPSNYYEQMGVRPEALKTYETLQYDILFGEQYGYGETKTTVKDPNYILGPGPMKIDEVRSEPEGENTLLTVTGEDLPVQSVLEVNGKAVTTKWNAEQKALQAEVPSGTLGKNPCKVKVVVKDSKDKQVAVSNEFSYAASDVTGTAAK
ncbi:MULTISPECIES: LTA synthase family protein [Paenibacillus]|uniref:LTA synthase family protein n=1 Tax=Paenibacillus TaxID=44249 RepID=UPI0022B8C4CB|nr:LTA synthase family protein [Paenibacillus caseinilyticus]MCZ8522624.1 LTA synthase family protein [Paenibacillus caseinilyticus]